MVTTGMLRPAKHAFPSATHPLPCLSRAGNIQPVATFPVTPQTDALSPILSDGGPGRSYASGAPLDEEGAIQHLWR
jgi:hypothetical protein